jgi:hypothetical protein
MPEPFRYLGQAIVLAAVMALIGTFAASPAYQYFPEDRAQIKLSFRHGGARLENCRKLTPEEIARLPANKKRQEACSRERLPVTVLLLLDGQPIYEAILKPTGLAGGGASEVYEKFAVSPGPHVIEAKLRDSNRKEGFDFENRFAADLKPLQNLAIDFRAEQGGFQFR